MLWDVRDVSGNNDDDGYWARPLKMFVQLIVKNGKIKYIIS